MYKKIVFIFVILICPYSLFSEENSNILFIALLDKYLSGDVEFNELRTTSDGGLNFNIFDKKEKISKDYFCQIELLGTLGKTQYLCYKKYGETDWLFEKKVMFYPKPYELAGSEISYAYFRFSNGVVWAYNDITKEYNLGKDVRNFTAIYDFKNLKEIVDIIEQNISRK
jgi:hypothetical protein